MSSGHVDQSKPLRPLTKHTWYALGHLAKYDHAFSHEFNPGVWDRLRRENLVEQVYIHRREAYRITDAGRAKWAARP